MEEYISVDDGRKIGERKTRIRSLKIIGAIVGIVRIVKEGGGK